MKFTEGLTKFFNKRSNVLIVSGAVAAMFLLFVWLYINNRTFLSKGITVWEVGGVDIGAAIIYTLAALFAVTALSVFASNIGSFSIGAYSATAVASTLALHVIAPVLTALTAIDLSNGQHIADTINGCSDAYLYSHIVVLALSLLFGFLVLNRKKGAFRKTA